MARRQRQFTFPIYTGAASVSTGTVDADLVFVPAPSDCVIDRSVIRGAGNGTGTALIAFGWFSSASGGGTRLSADHKTSGGADYDLDAGLNTIVTANGIAGIVPITEGAALILFANFDAGTATGAGSFRACVSVIL